MPVTSDVLIVGAGVIGLTTALKLANAGASVTIVDRGPSGREASWAGAGILPPGNLHGARTAEARLRAYSHSLWPAFSSDLLERTGIDNGYHICGSLHVDTESLDHQALVAAASAWTGEGIEHRALDRLDLERLVADISPDIHAGVLQSQCGQVRNPRHLQALKAACLQRGVDLIEHVDGLTLTVISNRIAATSCSLRTYSFDQLCITAGAWSAQLLTPLNVVIPVVPVRGQIVQLQLPAQPFRCIIEDGRRYIVPRRDGLVLIGSTEEHSGFVKQNTSEGVAGLLAFATSLVPSLAQAEVVRTWAGLRPGTPDELPLIGRIPGFDNIVVGTGHFRSGIQMSVGTGAILADLILDRSPAVSLDGFAPLRFTGRSSLCVL